MVAVERERERGGADAVTDAAVISQRLASVEALLALSTVTLATLKALDD
jgi:hypothetical protein